MAKPLSENRENARRDVPILLGGHHLLDDVLLFFRELLRMRLRARRDVVELAFLLALPRVVSGLRKPDELERRSERQGALRAVDGSQK